MSKKSVNCASSGGSIGNEVKFAGNDSKNKMYEPKHKKKLVRVLTVIAYIFSVSLAAITLSLFYLFIYNPGKPGHNVGSTNNTSNGRFFGRNNEGAMVIFNSSYLNYEREEPRALPLETIQQSHVKRRSTMEGRRRKFLIPESKMAEMSGKKSSTSLLARIARTLSIT